MQTTFERLLARGLLAVILAHTFGCGPPPVPVPYDRHPLTSSSDGYTWDDAMSKLASGLAERLRTGNSEGPLRVAVVAFTTPQGGACRPGDTAAEDLTTRLFETGKFDVIERSRLRQIIREQSMGTVDLMDPSTVARLGRLVGASGVVVGTFSRRSDRFLVNARIVLVESADVVSAAGALVRRSDTEGACG